MKLSQLKLLRDKILFEPVKERQSKVLHIPDMDMPAPGNQRLWRVLKIGPSVKHLKEGQVVAAKLLNHDFVFPSGRVIADEEKVLLAYDTCEYQPA